MAEKLHHVERHAPKAEHIEVHVERKEVSSAEKAEAGERQKHNAEKARESVEKLALKTSEAASKKEGYADSEEPEVFVNKSYRSVMHRVESQLPTYQRVFSKVIRNPSVDKASVIVGDTIARPSGIIGGAGLAFFGLLVFGYTARTVGFELPNTLFVFLVIIGWTGGLFFDFLITSIKRILRARG